MVVGVFFLTASPTAIGRDISQVRGATVLQASDFEGGGNRFASNLEQVCGRQNPSPFITGSPPDGIHHN